MIRVKSRGSALRLPSGVYWSLVKADRIVN
jgi:hypothetical protein